MKRILILGGGTGGTLLANRLGRVLPERESEIVVVDRDDAHLYQPGLLFVPFGMAEVARITRSRHRQFRPPVTFHRAGIERVDVGGRTVHLDDGASLGYDVLVIASGARLMPEETEGLTGDGWQRDVFTFYTPAGAAALRNALDAFESGRIVVNMIDMPIKCPVAPIEFTFLADWYLRQRGRRAQVDLTLVTPLDGAFTKPVCNRELGGLLVRKGINVVTEFNTGEVDGGGGRLISFDGREIGFDLAVVIPLHGGQSYVDRSDGLGDALGFVPTDEHTLQAKAAPEIFAIGDATDLRSSKAGSVAHFQGGVVADNIRAFLAGEPLAASFDGHANCFIETGFGRALLIDFNYDTEPVPGHYPGRVGLPLLKESRLNHLGKLAFQQFYWHVLLPGREVPGIGSAMPLRGKAAAATPHDTTPAGQARTGEDRDTAGS